ncbi:MAG: hypothetical protein CVU06_03180 [Bacteroidetes bacterium HGW-Bacteroidetes-22]|nr:MAG: hypothetical protein CVU06_03180 [Bacteroidetes bacterium HGW-Bacteroidetes-22]
MINNLRSSKSMITKKLHLILFTIFCGLNSIAFSQGVYFQETGRGISLGGSYTYREMYGITITSITGELSGRVSRHVLLSIGYASLSALHQTHAALIPSVTVQTSESNLINFAASVGYANSKLTGEIPTLMLGGELFMRINRNSIFQIFPNLSISQSILLEKRGYTPAPVFGIGTNLGLRLSDRAFFVFGPKLLVSDGDTQLVGNMGIVII